MLKPHGTDEYRKAVNMYMFSTDLDTRRIVVATILE